MSAQTPCHSGDRMAGSRRLPGLVLLAPVFAQLTDLTWRRGLIPTRTSQADVGDAARAQTVLESRTKRCCEMSAATTPWLASGQVLEANGMVYSNADYGCAWQAGAVDRPLPRSVIREAFEFGANLVLYGVR
jgi:hypothetical protein